MLNRQIAIARCGKNILLVVLFLFLMMHLHIYIGFSLRTSLDQTTLNQSVSVNGVYSDQDTSQVRYAPHCAYIKFSFHDRSNYAFTFMHMFTLYVSILTVFKFMSRHASQSWSQLYSLVVFSVFFLVPLNYLC